MDLETIKTKEELRNLIDAYATLGDEKRISEQMELFTKDATYTVFMNGTVIAQTVGTDKLQQEFNGHAALVKTYFTLNGQHTVEVNQDAATGVSFTQIKMIREIDGKDILTDYSVKYEDEYVLENGKWLIKERKGHFIIIEARILNQVH